jgi:hypothetical protein
MATNNSINNPGNSFLTPANNLSDVSTPATARLNLFVPLSVNTGTVLTATAYGKEVICTGAAAYALTLPTVTSNANKFIDVFSQTTSGAIVTITPASGTIAGQSTLPIGSGDGVRIMNDGTNWWVLNTWLQPTSFRATLSAVQSIADNSFTKVTYDGTQFNIGSFFDTATNNRYTPLLPGKYMFHHSAMFAGKAASPVVESSAIYKNGSLAIVAQTTINVNSQQISTQCSLLTAMNGSTDFIEGFVYQSSGATNLNLTASSGNVTFLQGSRISLF